MRNQKVDILFDRSIELFVKREDLLHPLISGNKFRKLKYNLIEAKDQNKKCLLTFGGAYSNHILATAAAGNEFGFKTIGVIRGDELQNTFKSNPTLTEAKKLGMEFYFVTRENYKNKLDENFLHHLKERFEDFYLIPEGGTNDFAIKGCEEILDSNDSEFTHICCAVGTGGTISGLINASSENQKILGFPALKGDFLFNDIRKFVNKSNWDLHLDYHFGGYGKVSPELIHFLNEFYKKTSIPLDPIYTGKMLFGILDLIEKKYFPKNSKVLAIHTGGLQGIRGINKVLNSKHREYLIYEE